MDGLGLKTFDNVQLNVDREISIFVDVSMF